MRYGVGKYMRIVNLIENTEGKSKCLFEHGLSWYIVIDPSSWSFTIYISFLSTFNNRG